MNHIKIGDECYFVRNLDIFYDKSAYGNMEKTKRIIYLNNKENLKKYLDDNFLVKITNIKQNEASYYSYALNKDTRTYDEEQSGFSNYYYLSNFIKKKDINEFINKKLKEAKEYNKNNLKYVKEYYECSKLFLDFMESS